MLNLTIFGAYHRVQHSSRRHTTRSYASHRHPRSLPTHTDKKPTRPPPPHTHTTSRQQSNPIQQSHLGPSPGRPGTPLSAPPFTGADAGLTASFCCPTRRRRPLSDQSYWAQPPVVLDLDWMARRIESGVCVDGVDRSIGGRPPRGCPYATAACWREAHER